MGKYYESIAELYACDYFAQSGYNLENATDTDSGGLDLKIIDKNTGNYFYVEVTCIATYLGEDMENILNASGADFLPKIEIAKKLRERILPNSKKRNKATQISGFIKSNNLSDEDKIFLWIDLSRIVRTTKIIYDWLSPQPDDALVNVFYDQQQSYIPDTNNFHSVNLQLVFRNYHNVCDRLNGIMFYSDTDQKVKYLHNPHFIVNNPVNDFPACDFYYFAYEKMFYFICHDDLVKNFT